MYLSSVCCETSGVLAVCVVLGTVLLLFVLAFVVAHDVNISPIKSNLVEMLMALEHSTCATDCQYGLAGMVSFESAG